MQGEDKRILVCLFNATYSCYDRKEAIKELTDSRLESMLNASETRKDGFYSGVVERFKREGITLASHRSCISTYTSKQHISRYLSKRK